MYGPVAGLLHAVAVLPARDGGVAGRARPKNIGFDFFESIAAAAGLLVRGLPDATGDPGGASSSWRA